MSHPGNYDPYAPDPDDGGVGWTEIPDCVQCHQNAADGHSDGLCDRCRLFIEYRELRLSDAHGKDER